MSRITEQTAERSQGIDLLRALAIFLVLGRHMDRCPVRTSPLLHRLTDVWVNGGWVGVDLFFVLSGFLVSGLLFREHQRFGRISLKSFLIRRGFKIYPAFWLLILATLTVLIVRREHFKLLAVPCEFLFLQNYGPALWNHTWSLAVEEHFYFFLVLLLLGLSTQKNSINPFRLLPTLFMAIAVACLGLRLLTWHVLPRFVDKLNLYPTHLRMDSLFAGVLISYFYHLRREDLLTWARCWRWCLLVVGLSLFVPAFLLPLETSPFIYTFGLTLLYLGSGLLLLFALTATTPKGFISSAIAYVGSHSYSIYVWHMSVIWWFLPWATGAEKGKRNWFVYFAVYFLGAIGLGIFLANLIEFPLLRLRDRWFPSRAR